MHYRSFSRKRNINTLVTVTVYSYVSGLWPTVADKVKPFNILILFQRFTWMISRESSFKLAHADDYDIQARCVNKEHCPCVCVSEQAAEDFEGVVNGNK